MPQKLIPTAQPPPTMVQQQAPQLLVQPPSSDVDCQVAADPNFNEEKRLEKRSKLGLQKASTSAFVEACEFVSLGSYCAVSTALQALGLRKHAYPLDWARSPMDGVAHCVEMEFEDFLTFSTCQTIGAYQVFGPSAWGGSFWHHDPEAMGSSSEFIRRIDRFLGMGDVPPSMPRVFVRALNSSHDIQATGRLLTALKHMLPEADIHLLLLIDLQDISGLVKLAEFGDKVLFHLTHKDVWEPKQAANGDEAARIFMEKALDAYTEGIAKAVAWWADPKTGPEVNELSDLTALRSLLIHFEAGNPSSESFYPRRFRGQRIKDSCQMPNLLGQRPEGTVTVGLPAGINAGDFLQTEAFGRPIKIQVPEGASGGQNLQLTFSEGAYSVTLTTAAVAALVQATSAIASTTMATTVTKMIADNWMASRPTSDPLKSGDL